MSLSHNLDSWPESVRQFVFFSEPKALSNSLREGCLELVVAATVGQVQPDDIALTYGLGGETTRFTYWQGLIQAYGDPPLSFEHAKEIVAGYSAFSDLVPPREHIAAILLGSVSCAYEKGFTKEFGEIE